MEKEIYKIWYETYSRTWGHIVWEVSSQGNVKKNGVLYECRLNKGYKVFGRGYSVHRAVAMLFIPNPENKPQVDHINCNALDNRACNLRWATSKENRNNPITKRRQSESINNPITKRRLIESIKKLGPHSEEHKRKISESMKIYWQNKKSNKNRVSLFSQTN